MVGKKEKKKRHISLDQLLVGWPKVHHNNHHQISFQAHFALIGSELKP
jgi:hypothetical protein